jgi:hypothetical protein
MKWDGDTLEVLATSQKLAHRVAPEVEKAMGGKTTHKWSDHDGSLFATWQSKPTRQARKA